MIQTPIQCEPHLNEEALVINLYLKLRQRGRFKRFRYISNHSILGEVRAEEPMQSTFPFIWTFYKGNSTVKCSLGSLLNVNTLSLKIKGKVARLKSIKNTNIFYKAKKHKNYANSIRRNRFIIIAAFWLGRTFFYFS